MLHGTLNRLQGRHHDFDRLLRELCLTTPTLARKTVTTGTCRLCGEIRDLQRSHFLPAAFYAMARKASPTGRDLYSWPQTSTR
jgi:hypothetical protein